MLDIRLLIFAGILACAAAGSAAVQEQPERPVEVIDYLGRKVVLAKPARRIIALAPHIVENLYSAGAGELLVGAVGYSDFPPPAKKLPRVGEISSYSIETIVDLKPDLVVVWMATRGGQVLETLERLGVPTYASDPRTLADIARSLRDYGRLAGTGEVAMAAADKFELALAQLTEHYRDRPRVRVFYEVWHEPLQSLNNKHIVGDVLELCGGENIFGTETVLAPLVSREALLARNPQVILTGGQAQDHAAWVERWQKWSQVDAVARDHLYTVPGDWISRHTIRILYGARAVCEHLDAAR